MKKRILIIDDEAVTTRLIRRALVETRRWLGLLRKNDGAA